MAARRTSRRSSRRRDQPLARATVLRGSLIFAAFLGILYLAQSLYDGVPTTDYRKVYVSVPTVGNLLSHDAVRIGGTRVGQVHTIDLGDDGRPRVRLQLNPGTELPADTTVAIRANGLLGARYVQLVPGKRSDLLGDGATITGDSRSFTNGLPETLDTFDAPTRKGLQGVTEELSAGVVSQGGSLNGALRGFAIGTPKFVAIVRSVLARDGAASRLIPSLDSAMRSLAANRDTVRPGFTALPRAVRPFVTERDATRATLEQAPATLSATTSGLTRGRRLLGAVRRFAEAAAVTLPPAPDALRDLSVLLGEAKAPLRRLVPDLDRRLPDTAVGVRNLLVDVDKKLVPKATQAVDLSRPQLRYIGKHSCDFTNFGASMRSMTGFSQAGSGPIGPAIGFRLEVAMAAGLETLGLDASGPLGLGMLNREGYEPPCTYLSKAYPQLTQDPLGINTPGQGPGSR
jgi:virulence factor Mce-like protein